MLTQQLINGLTLGGVYALIALGYTMVYGILGLINFAHGEIYMLGAYLGIIFLAFFTAIGLTPHTAFPGADSDVYSLRSLLFILWLYNRKDCV